MIGYYFFVGVSVNDDFACNGAHAHTGPTSKSLWNGAWASVWVVNTTTFFYFCFFSHRVKLVLLTLLRTPDCLSTLRFHSQYNTLSKAVCDDIEGNDLAEQR